MTCREFEHLRSTRLPGDLPPAARDHLAACASCAAEVATDAAADAALHRLAATEPPVSTGAARAAIRQALAATPPRDSWLRGRRPFVHAACGLAAVALAALLAWPAIRGLRHDHEIVLRAPSPSLTGSVETSPSPAPRLPRLEGPKLVAVPGTTLPSVVAVPLPDRIHGAAPPSPRNAPEEVSSADLLFLNEGHGAGVRPYAPLPAAIPPLPPLPLAQQRKPGSLVVDDLLNLNPILVAAAGDTGFRAAQQTISAADPTRDARLQQKVFVHSSGRIADLLKRLSEATGVQLVARLEVADVGATMWADNRTLMDVMRDLRHLHGYYWSRSKQNGQYVYSLWQDAQSRAREEAEVQRLAMKKQREFEESIWKHVQALHASDSQIKQWAAEDPYFVAEMQHPVVRGGYELFAALAPDQQAQLTMGQTPSRGLSSGEAMELFPEQSRPGDRFWNPASWVRGWSPQGDIVTISWSEMTPAQREAARAIIRGAGVQQARDADERKREDPSYDAARTTHELSEAQAMTAADLDTATVSLFRWGDPNFQGLSLRVTVQSGGRAWGIYSNIGMPPGSDQFYNDALRQGHFHAWAGAQEAIDRYWSGSRGGAQVTAAAPSAAPAVSEKPDPILDRPVSLNWPLPLRMGQYRLTGMEVLAHLHQDLPYPIVLDGGLDLLTQPRDQGPVFRWEHRRLRALLQRLYPGQQVSVEDGAIFIRDPNRLQWRLNQPPRAIEEFLAQPGGPYTLDDMALVARSLTPWQIVKLQPYLAGSAIDQTLAARELLSLYGELAPAQRSQLAAGLPFAALTPVQQALFLRFAQRQRPFVEPWRFQHGALQLTLGPSPVKDDGRGAPVHGVTRAVFQVRFDGNDSQSFPVDLFPRTGRVGWQMPLTTLIGKPFPGFEPITWKIIGPEANDPIHQPVLTDPRFRHRAEVILIARPFAEPYVATRPAPDSQAWASALAGRLRDTGLPVVDLRLGPPASPGLSPSPAAGPWPNLIRLWEPGDENGQPFDSLSMQQQVDQSPTVFVVGRDEIVRAIFQGQEAWDMASVERAARRLLAAPAAAAPAGAEG